MKIAFVHLAIGLLIVVQTKVFMTVGVAHGNQAKPATPQDKPQDGKQPPKPNQNPVIHDMMIINGRVSEVYTFKKNAKGWEINNVVRTKLNEKPEHLRAPQPVKELP
jgi:hypothetical protein